MPVCICPDAGKDGHGYSCPSRKPPKRVFDDPDHPQYGPVRRLWVVMAQLDMLDAAERWSQHKGRNWDQAVAFDIADCRLEKAEQFIQRLFLQILMEGWV